MDAKSYRRAWVKRAFAGNLVRALLVATLIGLFLSPIALIYEPWKGVMNWLPTVVFGIIFLFLVFYGLGRAPYLLHKEITTDRDTLKTQLDNREQLQAVLMTLAKLRVEGVQLRGDAASKRVLFDDDRHRLSEWNDNVIKEIEKISPVQAELFGTLDTYVTENHPPEARSDKALLNHSERVKRLKELINSFDPAINIAPEGS